LNLLIPANSMTYFGVVGHRVSISGTWNTMLRNRFLNCSNANPPGPQTRCTWRDHLPWTAPHWPV
jgi:hypothetical protein